MDFFAEAGRAGHCLWYHVLPSLTWLPFLRMRSLHFGQVPIGEPFSFTTESVAGRRDTSRYYSNAVTDCVFCRIVSGQSPADIEYEDDDVLAFKDIYPKAPVHILIVPKRHIESIMTVEPGDAALLGRCLVAARAIGERTGFSEKGYRVTVNCGPEGGQVVYHVHFHFTAGRRR